MPPRQQPPSPYLDEHHQRISEFADEYFDDEEERASFVDTLLERRGYQRTAGWSLPPEPPPNGTAGGQPPRQSRSPYFKRLPVRKELRELFYQATQERLGESDRIVNAIEDVRKAISVLNDRVDAIEPVRVDLTQEMADDIVRKIHGPLTIPQAFSDWIREQAKYHEVQRIDPLGYGPNPATSYIALRSNGTIYWEFRDELGTTLWRGTFVPPDFVANGRL